MLPHKSPDSPWDSCVWPLCSHFLSAFICFTQQFGFEKPSDMWLCPFSSADSLWGKDGVLTACALPILVSGVLSWMPLHLEPLLSWDYSPAAFSGRVELPSWHSAQVTHSLGCSVFFSLILAYVLLSDDGNRVWWLFFSLYYLSCPWLSALLLCKHLMIIFWST